jgi:hypothetical protein
VWIIFGMTQRYSLKEIFIVRVVQCPGPGLEQAARCIIDCTALTSAGGNHEHTSAFLRSDYVQAHSPQQLYRVQDLAVVCDQKCRLDQTSKLFMLIKMSD